MTYVYGCIYRHIILSVESHTVYFIHVYIDYYIFTEIYVVNLITTFQLYR